MLDRLEVKKVLHIATQCDIQYDGWPCGTCFFALNSNFDNKDWQSLLFFRGDNKKEDLKNLPRNWTARVKNILKVAKRRMK